MCGTGRVTEEHAFPKWLREIFRGTEPGQISDRCRGINTYDRERASEVFNATVNSICRDCNGGWMSRLESATKPVLGPMIYGQDATLPVSAQEILCRWAVKTAIVFQSRNPSSAAVTEQQRRRFCGPLHPLAAATDIQIAAFREPGDKVLCAHWYLAGSSRHDSTVDCFIATFLLGRCVLQVVKTNPQVPVTRDNSWAGRTVRLLPDDPTTITWPTAAPLTSDDLNGFARSLGSGVLAHSIPLPPFNL